ncbi:MAG TPA: alpha/beta hydrolase [Niallia sp.]|nr:alpha/beta hydrolase [Niallia sp.]
MKKLVINNNVQMAYEERGQGETIVLIHGFCGNVHYWDEIIPVLSEKYHVLLLDLRGHGNSSYNGESFEIEDLAKDIQHLLEQLTIDKVMMFGHSLGGYVTLAFAELFPEKLSAFGLIHSTAYEDTEQGKAGRLNAIQKIQDVGINEYVDGLIPNLFSDESIRTQPDEISKAKEIGYGTNPVAAMETQAAMRKRPDRNEIIVHAKVPVLLVKGTKDKVVSLDRVTYAKDTHIMEAVLDSGHMSMIEAPEQLTDALFSFFKQV